MEHSGVEEYYLERNRSGSGPYDESACSGKEGWILEKGLTLGKRLLITGFVVSSAPVVVPPFLVISAIGFACSIPYGLFLATYSFNEILMPKLFPLPTLPLPQEEDEFVDVYDDDQDKYQTWSREGESILETADDGLLVKENGHEEDVGGYRDELFIRDENDELETIEEEKEEPEDKGLEVCAVSVIIEEGDGVSGGSSRRSSILGPAMEPIEEMSVVVEVFEDGDSSDDNEEFAKETTGLLESIRDEGLAVDGYNDEAGLEEAPLKDEKNISVPIHSHEAQVSRDAMTDASYAAQQQENGTAGSSEAAILQSAQGSEVGGDTKQNGANVAASTEVWNKEQEEEEKIWEQINALRAIVGYKGSRQTSFMEELKALYVFTGVATSFTDPCDVVEVNGKLRNLKLIVGVK
ncbi:hypothetical protein LINPERHAP2_LOCUS24549 [Linum perenne]